MAKKNQSKKTYKVLVEIEVIDEKGEHYEDSTILPDSLGTFKSLKQAAQRQWEVTSAFGIDPENSDAR